MASLSTSRSLGEDTFLLRRCVSSLDVDLSRNSLDVFSMYSIAHLLGDACLELDLENLPCLSPANYCIYDCSLYIIDCIHFHKD